MASREVKTEVYPYQIAFNLLPHIGSFSEEGDCSEEVKIANETRKILDAPTLRVTATTVRVPVLRCHSESINVELERPLNPQRGPRSPGRDAGGDRVRRPKPEALSDAPRRHG